MINHTVIKNIPTWLLISAAVFVSLVFIIVAFIFIYSARYESSIYPGVNVAGIDLGGKTMAEAKTSLEENFNRLNQGVPVNFENKNIVIGQSVSPDLSIPLTSLDLNSTLANAWSIGRSKDFFSNTIDRLWSLAFGRSLVAVATVDREAITAVLKKEFSTAEVQALDAGVVFEQGEFSLVKEKTGVELNYQSAVDDIINRLSMLSSEPVNIKSKRLEPKVIDKDIIGLIPQLEGFFNFSNTKLIYQKNSWPLTLELAHQWVGFSKIDNKIKITLDKNKIKDWLTKEVATKIDQEPAQAKLSINGGRVSVWQSGKDGFKLELDQTADKIYLWPQGQPTEIEAVVNQVASGAEDATASSLGLKEIIGTGISNFAGSPANRRHNIKVGADALNGLLIKPGEEFSLLKALGRIDGSTGYLQELVIKENKTIPEFGGGLCQIGTTLFRTTFNSGLPVTQRRNHSYRVVYYEPAGTDATIYDPAPDYRFINDTGNHILIQTRIEGNQAIFDFWGTKDGRQIDIAKPVIYNITAPGPTKIVETPTLKEGEKKCTEKAHNGADAYFDYKVTYPGGEVKAVRFSSHYVPWQAVCLVGAKRLPDGTIAPTITPTVTPVVTPSVAPAVN